MAGWKKESVWVQSTRQSIKLENRQKGEEGKGSRTVGAPPKKAPVGLSGLAPGKLTPTLLPAQSQEAGSSRSVPAREHSLEEVWGKS